MDRAISPNTILSKGKHHRTDNSKIYLKQKDACYAADQINILPNIKSVSPCLLQLQQLNRSQSITALPNFDLYGSYATLIPGAAVERTAVCQSNHQHQQQHLNVAGKKCFQKHYEYYYPQNVNHTVPPICLCGNFPYDQRRYQHSNIIPGIPAENQKAFGNGYYFGYDHEAQLAEEEDSAFPVLADREFYLLHRNVPALRRTGIDTTGIRQYFYPDGGWGWIICGVSFLVHILTTGLQLSHGLLLFYAVQHLHSSTGIEWLGALTWSISMLCSPFVVTFCRKKSTRLLAVVGGLVLPLGILFTSFATELTQIIFSYGVIFGIGVAMVRESSTIMLGNYFKRRRQFVEMVVMSGEGVGIALFSVIFKEGVGKVGWRLGLQIIAALVATSFFMGFLYRPASLYHPQRRAIQHLKNQRKKMRENKKAMNVNAPNSIKYFFVDISSLKSGTVRILLMISAISALGVYTPMFLMSLNAAKEGSDIQDLVLLQTFLGMSTVLGIVISGVLVRRPIQIRKFIITTQVLSQVYISTVALAILFLSFVMSFKGLCLLSWIYGIGFGGFRYSMKMLALQRVKAKQFSKAWGLIRGIEAVPVLISVPLTSYLNDYSLKYGRAGYYICSAAAAITAIILFFVNYSDRQLSSSNRKHSNDALSLWRSTANACKSHCGLTSMGCNYPGPDLLNRSCVSLNQVETENAYRNANCICLEMPYAHQQHQHRHNNCHQPDHPIAFKAPVLNMREHSTSRDAVDVTQAAYHQYNYGQGSVDARMGKQMQKSLSFIQNPCCYNGQWCCNCHNCHWSYRDLRTDPAGSKSHMCTCSPYALNYLQNTRSRSVPEGLSTMAQHCSCKTGMMSPEIIYLPRTAMPYAHSSKEALMQRIPLNTTSRHRQTHLQKQTKPIHFVEQITTSV